MTALGRRADQRRPEGPVAPAGHPPAGPAGAASRVDPAGAALRVDPAGAASRLDPAAPWALPRVVVAA
ncbi:hypothetical protein ACWENR_26270, partial [Micromonospora sp. NPDC004336]